MIKLYKDLQRFENTFNLYNLIKIFEQIILIKWKFESNKSKLIIIKQFVQQNVIA